MTGSHQQTIIPNSEFRIPNLRSWLLIAILGSLLLHVALFSWFQQTRLRGLTFTSSEKLKLRKFNLERVQINPKWMEPRLPPPEHVSTTPSPTRSSLTAQEEKRTFARLLAEAPSSPTMPAGAPYIPDDKPVPALGEHRPAAPDQATRSLLDQELRATREQQLKKSMKAAGTGRPILSTPGAPVPPKAGSKDLAIPTQPRIGPDAGPDVGAGTSVFKGSIRLDDFFGPGGLPPPLQASTAASSKTNKPSAMDTASQVPQSLLKDKPATSQKFESLNPFLDVELFTYERLSDAGKKEGYFLVRISAKPNQQLRVIPKDVYFVLDVSSSIGGTRLNSYVATVLSAIAQLNETDRFKIMAFRDKPLLFRQDWISARDLNASEVRTWLGKLDTGGVTDFYDALQPLTQHRREEGRMVMALVMSDGLPTKGVLDSTQIISELSEANDSRTSIFALSNGKDVNNFLLDLLSYCNQGRLRYSEEVAASPDAFEPLVRQTRNPLFLDPRFRFAGVDGDQVYPQNLPNLYQDSPLLLFGRYTPGQTTKMSLQILGESFNSTRELLVQLPIPKTPNGPESLPSTWARQRIYHLLSRMTRSRTRQETILNEVRQLSESYKVEVPYF